MREILESLPSGSEMYIGWLCDQSDGIGPSFDRTKVLAALAAHQEGYGIARPAEALEAAAAVLSKAQYVDRELVVVSDVQAISWSPDQAGAPPDYGSARESADPACGDAAAKSARAG